MPSKENLSKNKIKILVLDDHPIVRQGFALLIHQEEDLMLSGEAGNSNDAIQCFKKNKPDFAIVDLSLKDTNGLELTKKLLNLDPNLPILIVSMHDEFLYAERALKAGAKGYLMKQEATENIITAIRKILQGEIYLSNRMRDNLIQQVATGKHSEEASPLQRLTDRELEVLQLLGEALTTRQIAESLHLSIKTIESHYARIKEKLNLKSLNELIQYAAKWQHTENQAP